MVTVGNQIFNTARVFVPDAPSIVFQLSLPTSEGPIITIRPNHVNGPEVGEGHRVECMACDAEYQWDSDWHPHTE